MQRRMLVSGMGLALLVLAASCYAGEEASPTHIRQAVDRAMPVMLKSIAEYPHHNACFSCHHQGVPTFALALARSHGYTIDEKSLQSLVLYTTSDLRADLPHYVTLRTD